MTPERWLQIKTLFDKVLDHPAPQRQEFLDQTCREDDDLRREIESLLECANQIEDDFLAPLESNSATRTPTGFATSDEKTMPGKAELSLGEVIQNRYHIERELGRGGFSIVYLARETLYQAAGGPPISRPVVIKCLLSETIKSAWHHQKFQHEIEALSVIDHPGVVGLLEVGRLASGQPFLVMPFIDGNTLRTVIKPPGMEAAKAMQLIRHLCNALAAVHAKGIIHRDLKPENVMLLTAQTGETQAKLIDFGIAKLSVSQIGATTQQPVGAGTLKYMAPEQMLDGVTSPQSDIFALGIIVFEILTGQRPFDSNAATPFAVSRELSEQHQRGPHQSLAMLRPDLPPAVNDAVSRALAVSMQDRWATTLEFQINLEKAFANALPESESPLPAPVETSQTLGVNPFDTNLSPTNPAAPQSGLALHWQGWLVGFLAVAMLGFGFWRQMAVPDRNGSVPLVQPPPPTVRQNQVGWSLVVQKKIQGKPAGAPFSLFQEPVFSRSEDFLVRLNLTATQAGHLYVINQGPGEMAATEYVKVFPTPTANQNQSEIQAHRLVSIPEKSWLEFKGGTGTEIFWLVWSREPQPELENLPVGKLRPSETEKMRDFLSGQVGVPPGLGQVSNGQNFLEISGNLGVIPLKIERR
ncbi:MAG: serine/threonine protein kinase [Blastocatellia bacterium]|nr:serine/threonine protein kinase [Blastocatellia bacterium]